MAGVDRQMMAPFKEVAPAIWRLIADDFEAIGKERPLKQEDGATGAHFGEAKVLAALAGNAASEMRNVCCNLTWAKPFDICMGDFTYGKVIKFAKAYFWKDNDPCAPPVWPRNMNVPIAVFSMVEMPTKGVMQRYGLDLAVAAFWVALATANEKKLPPATTSAFHQLARTAVHVHVFTCSCSWT